VARVEKKSYQATPTVERGWGFEKWIENIPEYCGKILTVYARKRGSLHFHMDKTETMYLASGAVDLLMVDPETGGEYTVELRPGDSVLIPRGQVHQIVALVDSEIFEFSTIHQESDSYRVRKGD
jgi:mannose-6-phosphate isomerase-like protein (cupin superfamily)